MPVKAGLDFGTTTSILSYLEGENPRVFHYGGKRYVPSVVAYTPKELFIGDSAVAMLTSGADIYRYFKMLLPEEDNAEWKPDYGPYLTKRMTPAQVAADFIGELINGSSPGRERLSPGTVGRESFHRAQGERIEALVVSVPQVWSDIRALGRQQLQTVVRDLGLPLMHLVSEPVAAAAYFTHIFRKKQGADYCGNLLVCDMGGGTFDVTLCRLKPNRVEVLHNEGNGARGLGIAGAHFDETLLRGKLDPGEVSPEAWSELLLELDLKKKLDLTAVRIMTYLQSEDHPLPIFAINSTLAGRNFSFNFEEVLEAFAPVRAGIFEVLGRVKGEANRRGYKIDKVVLVGGFSLFPLVQQAVCEFFGEDIFENRTLVDLETLSRDNMAFAISYGACLLANGMVEVSEKYDHTVGIVVTDASGRDEELELIAAGKSLDALVETAFCCWPDGRRRRFRITRDTVEAEIFILLSGGTGEADKLVKKVSLRDVPNSHARDNRWFLGTRVDRSKIPYLVIEDEASGRREEYPLGELIPDIIMERA